MFAKHHVDGDYLRGQSWISLCGALDQNHSLLDSISACSGADVADRVSSHRGIVKDVVRCFSNIKMRTSHATRIGKTDCAFFPGSLHICWLPLDRHACPPI